MGFFDTLKRITLYLLYALTIAFGIAMVFGRLFFNFEASEVLGFFLIGVAGVFACMLIFAILAAICYFLFSKPCVICWLGCSALVIVAVWFVFWFLIKQPILAF